MPRGIEELYSIVHDWVVIKKSSESLERYSDSLVDFKMTEKTYDGDRINSN